MKSIKNSILIILFSISAAVYGQTPGGINYQAVARDGSGDLIKSKAISVKAVILSGSSGSNVEYTETHAITTNDYGLFTLIIGEGSTSDNFGAISWGTKKHHLKIEIDNGAGFVNMGTMALQSVPYALSAKNVENMPTIALTDLSDVTTAGAGTGQVLGWDGTSWKPVNAGGSGATYVGGSGITVTGNTIDANTGNAIWNADKLQNRAISNSSPTSGQLLGWNGTAWAPTTISTGNTYTAGTGLTLTGTSFAANTTTALWNANQLQGRSIATTAPSSNQVLKWNGSSWAPAADNGSSYTASTGLTLTGTSFSANTATALWNANKLQGRSVATTAPTSGQLLSWDGTNWKPKSITEGYWDTTGTTIIHTSKQVGIGTDSPVGQFDVIDTITATANGANYVTTYTQTRGTTGNQSTSVGNWTQVDGQGGYENIGFRSRVFGSSNATYVGTGGVGGYFIADCSLGQNNFGVRLDCSPNNTASVRNYGVYSHSRGNGTFNMGVFALSNKSTTGTGKTNYGIYAQADSGSTNYAGYFAGNVTYTGTLAQASDARLKNDIIPFEDALSKIENIQVKTYSYKQDGDFGKMNLPEGNQIGFIAQDLEKTFPDLVKNQVHALNTENNKLDANVLEYKAVNYIGMIPVLTKAIQEQQAYIELLEKRLEKLELEANK